ncbi:sugar ABC transporter substrate-binding protein [Butyrivibrio sp. YAB3001]|uniref:sugar ABC transporter substrate-binding protein n=1 Tax=Butyrivibrio sp. YAB3001 TaxID=1520812 RepID=UPI0008F64AD8|nr:substrate-binding domain-containing protein [Butyrivibrio sp. YAB3001]SFC99976.1 ribose transport system substrate-binding protein [Butyrivibrio sp. YAB3001]
MSKLSEDLYKKRISRQYLILVITLIFVLATLVTGSLYFRFYKNDIVKQSEAKAYDKYFVMITGNYKSDFWQSIYKGALEVAKEANIYVDLLGANLSGDYSCEDLMKIAIASKVDGIIVYANESDTMTELINEAVDSGIPVVTLYGDSTHSERLSFVGIGGYSVGKMYGKQIIDIIKEKRREDFIESDNIDNRTSIKVAVLANADSQDAGQNIIISTMQDTIKDENVTDSEFEVSIVAVDNTNTFSIEESIRDIFLKEEVPDVIVCLNELNTVCTYQAVVDFNMVGEVNILGYYDSVDIVNAIDRGGVYATISIDTKQLGEYSISALLDYYETGNTSEYYLADVTLIDRDNVAEFIQGEDIDG